MNLKQVAAHPYSTNHVLEEDYNIDSIFLSDFFLVQFSLRDLCEKQPLGLGEECQLFEINCYIWHCLASDRSLVQSVCSFTE